MFPDGLLPSPTTNEHPAVGVIVTKDSDKARKAGLQAGDIIVGLEGWRVDNLEQYRAVNAFYKQRLMKLTAWRGKLAQIEIETPNRLMGIEFRSYPIKGWSER